MKHLRNNLLLFLLLLLSSIELNAQTILPSILSDNMCLQQLSDVKIWGWDTPGQSITVKPSWTGSSKTVTDNDGNWLVSVKTPEAGGSYKIRVTGSSQHIISNILIGEVWLCSGQSNMERELGFRIGQKPIVNFKETSEKANYPKMRLFKLANMKSETPLHDCGGKWVECSPETALEFSAVGFFYGKALYKGLSIPVGLIQSAWGGTPVEAWSKKEDFDKKLAERYSTLDKTYQLDSSYYYQALSNYKKGSIVNKPDMPESVNYNLRKHKKLSVLYNILKIDKNQIQMTPRENILKTLRREGFETVPVDYVFCVSQITDFEKRFGHKDYESHFGLCHRSFEMDVQRNFTFGPDQFKRESLPDSTIFDEYGIGHSKGSAAAFHMTRMHRTLKGFEKSR